VTSVFEPAAERASAVVAETFGEPAIIRPMTTGASPNGLAEADEGRAVIELPRAVFRRQVEEVTARSPYDPRALERLRSVGAEITVKMPLAGLPYHPRIGDRVERPETGEVFSVVAPQSQTRASLTLRLAIAAPEGGAGW
jgi:hypothetical protein